MASSNLELTRDVLVAALQSGKLSSYEPLDVAAYFKIIHEQICLSDKWENGYSDDSPVVLE